MTANITDTTEGTEVCEDNGIEEDLATLPEFEDGPTTEPLVIWMVYFLALLQKKHFLPDAALSLLLRFFSIFFKIVGSLSPQLKQFSDHFPPTLYKFHKLLGTRKAADFIRYVVCPGCSMVYKFEDCVEKVGTQTRSKCIASLIESLHVGESCSDGLSIKAEKFTIRIECFAICHCRIT